MIRCKAILCTTILALAVWGGTAHAQRSRGRGVGVGAQAMLAGPSGASVVYDIGDIHIDGILNLATNGDTVFGLGGRVFYAVNRGQNADFSIGGGLGITTVDPGAGVSRTIYNLEGNAKVRAFIVPNVALHAVTGLAILLGDGDGVGINSQLLSSVGITYFFQ